MKIKAHKLLDENFGDRWSQEVEDKWEYQDFLDDPAFREGWISFDCAYYNPDDHRIWARAGNFVPWVSQYRNGAASSTAPGYEARP